MPGRLFARRSRRGADSVPTEADTPPVDRRGTLRLGGMAAAGAAGAALMTAVDASPAAAGTDGDVVLGGPNNASVTTSIDGTFQNGYAVSFLNKDTTGA